MNRQVSHSRQSTPMEMTSQSQTLANPLLISSTEMEVPLCDQSMKRHAEVGDDEVRKQRKALKKRRSSLSSVRRSIVMGDLPVGEFSSVSVEL